jgi:DNA-binding XRE family transcriptional regulator
MAKKEARARRESGSGRYRHEKDERTVARGHEAREGRYIVATCSGSDRFAAEPRARREDRLPARRSDVVEVPRADYEAMIRRIEDLEDVRALDEARTDPAREELPARLVRRLLSGKESRVALWRAHRGLSQRALAEKAGVQPGYLSEIESGKKPGSVKALAALARALDVEVEDLIGREE